MLVSPSLIIHYRHALPEKSYPGGDKIVNRYPGLKPRCGKHIATYCALM
jgi:hypothetical protein